MMDREELNEWAKDKPLSILRLDPVDRAILKIAGKFFDLFWGGLQIYLILLDYLNFKECIRENFVVLSFSSSCPFLNDIITSLNGVEIKCYQIVTFM